MAEEVPVPLVPKSDGTTFCIDFRKVHLISRFDAYLLPRVQVRLEAVKYTSTLDLMKRYWQIPLTSESQEKTAFSAPFSLYHF